MSGPSVLTVGLAVGHGTGRELADVFEKVIVQLASQFSVDVELRRSPRVYHSYLSLLSAGESQDDVCKETMHDAAHYEEFCREEAARGTRVLFRTAITAQALYLVRQRLECIKIENFNQGSASVLLIRDQTQGFYTGSNTYDASNGSVSRTCHFNKGLTGRIIKFALERAGQIWSNDAVTSIIMVYKHHLFDGIFDTWAAEWTAAYGIKVNFVQPDTMNRNLLAFGIKGRQLIIAGNEYADIMQVYLLKMFGQGVQETTYAENIYLHPQLFNLSEYQTVHGSADDLMGKGLVNPTATIKAAVAILERYGACQGVELAMENQLQDLMRRNLVTPDQGGSMSTSDFVDIILGNFKIASLSNGIRKFDGPAPSYVIPSGYLFSMGKKTALIVIDIQNEFVAAARNKERKVCAAAESPIGQLTSNIERLITFSRTQQQQQPGYEIIYVRFLGDQHYLPQAWQYRNYIHGMEPWCLEHSTGAEIVSAVSPFAGEKVFDKKAAFDAFFCEGFETYLQERGYEHLILSGVYADVCVDATARTAFQKGYYLTIVEDCTTTLHMDMDAWLNYVKKVYGARVVKGKELMEMSL